MRETENKTKIADSSVCNSISLEILVLHKTKTNGDLKILDGK